MAKTIIYTLFSLLIIFSNSRGESYKSGDYVLASNILRMISLYHKEKGSPPVSWREIELLIDIEAVSSGFDYKSKYAFPREQLILQRKEGRSRVISMGISPIKESARNGDLVENSRLLLFLREGEIFEVSKIKESALRQIFKNSGYNLDDYTGETGKWSNLDELSSSGEVANVNIKSPKNPINQSLDENIPFLEESEKISGSSDGSRIERSLAAWLIGILGLGIIAIIATMIFRKQKS